MKLIRTEDAVGQVLCHDITQIIPGVVKDAVFRKGHIVTKEDIPILLSVGKEHLYVWEKKEGILHEDEAAVILRDLCINDNMTASEPKEGKIEIRAAADGLLKINSEKLRAVNGLGEMMIATIHGNFPVKAGDRLAATRIIPLVIEEEKMNRAKEAAGGEPLLKILPMSHKKVGIVTTGSEVFKGRIQDAFGPAIRAKLAAYDTEVMGQVILDDCQEDISAAILKFVRQGADMVLCTGGMSVDPDDRTPGAIKATGADIVSYGAPVLPGAMFLLSYLGEIPVLGLPGCVMRIIPLVIEEEKMNRAKEAAGGEPLLKILPMSHKKVGIVTTGSEVFKGRIQDAFGPAIRAKLAAYDTEVMGQVILDDCQEDISAAILKFVRQGADMVLCTGGMSVDPDDRTPGAIKATGADIVSYGAPVLPGAMFLLSYLGEIPVLGLPGCVMYAGRTVFDLVLPRVLAGERLTKADLDSYGEGGLCLNCEVCHFPNCGFGKQ